MCILYNSLLLTSCFLPLTLTSLTLSKLHFPVIISFMPIQDFMNKVRYWDNMAAKWLMRHFYFIFFQIVLFIIFLFWFVNMFNVIDISHIPTNSNVERILATQSVNITILVFLLLVNSFWLLYMFSGIQRMTNLLKDISFHISRLRLKSK